MEFKDLMVGDWFIDMTNWFVDSCVLMKINDTEVVPLNCGNITIETVDPEMIVKFCPKFTTTLKECISDEECEPWAFEDFNEPDFRLEKDFNAIPMYAIFKGQGQTYYKRIDESHTIVVWSPKQETMGKIFERPDWKTHRGTYYICHKGLFQYPEDMLVFPYNGSPFVSF